MADADGVMSIGLVVDRGIKQLGVGEGVAVPTAAEVGSAVGDDMSPAVGVGVGVHSGIPVSVPDGLADTVGLRLGAAAGRVLVSIAVGVVVPSGRAVVPRAGGTLVPNVEVDGALGVVSRRDRVGALVASEGAAAGVLPAFILGAAPGAHAAAKSATAKIETMNMSRLIDFFSLLLLIYYHSFETVRASV